MLQPICPSLSALAELLREKHNVRLSLLARAADEADLLKADFDVFCINRQITSHRRRCPRCAPAPAFAIATPGRPRPVQLDRAS
jgi:hypothetical protein